MGLQLADTFIIREVNKKFDLSSEQEKKLKGQIVILKRELLQREGRNLATVASEIALLSQQPFTDRSKFDSLAQQIEKEFLAIYRSALPIAKELLASLSDKQWQHYEQEMAKVVKRDQEEIADSKKITKSRKSWHNGLEYFFDEVTPEQEKWVAEFVAQNKDFIEMRALNKQQTIAKFSVARKNPATLNQFLDDYFTSPEKIRSPEYHTRSVAYQKAQRDLIWRILTSLKRDQRHYFGKRMQHIHEDLKLAH